MGPKVGALATLLTAFAAMVAFGLVGAGRSPGPFADARFHYLAARMWLQGQNPYDLAAFRAFAQAEIGSDIAVFAYPPQSFLVGGALAPFSLATAEWVLALTSVVCVLVLALLAVETLRARATGLGGPAELGRARWMIPAICIGAPFTAHVLWTGQVSLIISACILGGWLLVGRGRWLGGGLLLGVATLKPHLVLFPLLWLVVNKRWPALLSAAAGALACAAVPMSVSGPIGALREWLGAVAIYQSEAAGAYGNLYVLGVRSFLSACGVHLTGAASASITAVAVAAVIAWLRTRRVAHHDALAVLAVLSPLLIYSHDYDLVALVPTLAAMWWLLLRRGRAQQWAALALMALLFVPQRLLAQLGAPPPLMHWRTLLLLVVAAWLMVLLQRQGEERVEQSPPADPAGAIGPLA